MYKLGLSDSFSKTITESDVYTFAGITGDFNPVHIDEIKAKEGKFSGRIAHGILLAGFISTVIGTKMPGNGTVYLEQDIKFLKPVYIGDTITAEVTVSEILNDKKNILKLSTIIKNHKQEIVCEGFAVVKAP